MTRTSQPLTFLLAAAASCFAIDVPNAKAVSTAYFDVNDYEAGSGVSDETGYTWDASLPYWNPNADGTGPAVGSTLPWINGDNAVFSAGVDAIGQRYGVFIASGITAGSATIDDGRLVIVTGTLDTGSGTVTVNTAAALEINSPMRLNQTAGKVVLNGGALLNANPGQAGSFLGNGLGLKGLEVTSSGAVSYDDGDGVPDNKVSIFFGTISGTGGTTSNGGSGTLVKFGPDQLGIAGHDLGGGVNSQSASTYSKLVIKQGGVRGRGVSINALLQFDERAFGAVPLTALPDAITLDGGGIGVNITTTLHANRGVTIGPDGGYFDHGAGASLGIPGPLSGSGTLTIGDPTSTLVNNVAFTLSNANNVNTFSGGLVGVRGRLQLNSSLTAASLNDSATNNATIAIAAGQTLTIGSSSGNDNWSTVISGAGSFTKVGSSTQTLSGTPTYAGDTRVQGGTLAIATAYLADDADVYLATGSTLSLGFGSTDVIRTLYINNVQQPAGTWGAPGSGAQFTTNLLTGTGYLNPTVGVPEPTALALSVLGLLRCVFVRRRK